MLNLEVLLAQASQGGMFMFWLAVLVLFAVAMWALNRRAPGRALD
jgi:hypothetical protein